VKSARTWAGVAGIVAGLSVLALTAEQTVARSAGEQGATARSTARARPSLPGCGLRAQQRLRTLAQSQTLPGPPPTAEIIVLRRVIQRHLNAICRAASTLRFFRRHPAALYADGMRRHRKAWRLIRYHRATLDWRTPMLASLSNRLSKLHAVNEGWYSRPAWMEYIWWRIAICESGDNPPNWQHDGGSFEGGLGFYTGSWLQFRLPGYPYSAADATPWQQVQVAERIRARFGYTGWGCA
jgi:hypothetical protein